MELSNLYSAFADFFIGTGNPGGNFFFSWQKGGYLLEDALFLTDNKAIENLSKVADSTQIFSQNLHYFSKVDKTFNSVYQLLLDSAQPVLPNDSSEQTVEQQFSNAKSAAENAFQLLGNSASEYGPTSFKAAQFEPLQFAHDNQFWQTKDFTVVLPFNPGPTTVSFQWVKVVVIFPWYKDNLVKFKTWYISDWSSGQAITEGLFAIPHSLIVIRNLTISGIWNAETIVTPGAIDPYSPFSYSGTTTPITENRMQVMGWIFEKLPPLPPITDPEKQLENISLSELAPAAGWSTTQVMANMPPFYYQIPWATPIPPQGIVPVAIEDGVRMENNHTYTAMRMWPPPIPFGTVRGIIGPVQISAAAVFTAQFGLSVQSAALTAPGIDVEVYISQLNSTGMIQSREIIFQGDKYYNRALLNIRAELTRFIGKSVFVELNVTNRQMPGATAYWIAPQIVFS